MDSSGSGQIIISEIAWMGTPVEGVDARQQWRHEWIELHNMSHADISVAGWSIELYRDDLDFVIPLQGIVAADRYLVAGSSLKINEAEVNYGTLAGKFANDGQHVVLRDNGGNVVEELNAKEGWFAGDNENKLTMERRFAERDAGDPTNWGSSMLAGGTPRAENSIRGKEAVLELGPQTLSAAAKESPFGLSFLEPFTSGVFILALLLALASALLLALLGQYLFRGGQDEGSSGALKD